ncbi:hypothetical protein CAOG_003728 [Capsaspora owczarzaki ATCC 30864]|uniref:C3H1-type domain-containing protein n=1 Tax=Capsaspora owczarzaki (strain ATCC 30864) TaxID=595528 RepID=A0A0D2WNQ2_CAPO3|nr:hypothetical protein CAOG_003728 [Capsaspora owczarzaki ATCC 30864]
MARRDQIIASLALLEPYPRLSDVDQSSLPTLIELMIENERREEHMIETLSFFMAPEHARLATQAVLHAVNSTSSTELPVTDLSSVAVVPPKSSIVAHKQPNRATQRAAKTLAADKSRTPAGRLQQALAGFARQANAAHSVSETHGVGAPSSQPARPISLRLSGTPAIPQAMAFASSAAGSGITGKFHARDRALNQQHQRQVAVNHAMPAAWEASTSLASMDDQTATAFDTQSSTVPPEGSSAHSYIFSKPLCQYWPRCKWGDECKFHHPSELCR